MLDYNYALKNLRKEELRGNNPVPDLLNFLHVSKLFGDKFDETLNLYLEHLNECYRDIKPLLKIDVPKNNFTIRPMSRPYLKEWLLYEAIIKNVSEKILLIHPDVCSRSYSIIRYKEKVTKASNPWLQFDNNAREFYNKGYNYAVKTDITGYYENINLEQLRSRVFDFLDETDENKKYVNLLFNMLRKWSLERIKNFGLPQGPPASSFLGDIFLDHVDRKMEKYQGYFRYMDDIRIFCQNEIEAKIALKELIISLRELKLNINAKKTDILVNEEIENKLFDPHHELMDFIDKAIDSGNHLLIENNVKNSLLKLFVDSFGEDPFDQRHLTFSLFRLDILYNSNININEELIINYILDNIQSKPHHTDIFCTFLINFSTNKNIWDALIQFLQSEENIYEWQEMKILQCLLRFNIKLDKNEREVIRTLCEDRNKHPIVGCFYILLFGKHCTNRERDIIIDMYNPADDNFRKSAILLAVQELGKASRNDFYSRIKSSDNEDISIFIDYIKTIKGPLYYLNIDKLKIETYKEAPPILY